MNDDDTPIHSPIAPFTVLQEGSTVLVIAACSCGEDCCLSAAIYANNFFTPDGIQGR